MVFCPMTGTRKDALVFAVFAAYNMPGCRSFPSSKVFPAAIVKFTNASSVLLHFAIDFVDGNAAAKVVTIMKTSSRGR